MPRCPECDVNVDAESINIKEGFALCPACGMLTRLGELNFSGRTKAEMIRQPPSGCSIETFDLGVCVNVSARSITGVLGYTALSLFWNGIVSIFVLIAVAGLYTNLVGPLPVWFPSPPLNEGKPEMNGEPMGLGETLFLCVFLIPFVTVGFGMIIAAIFSYIGKVEVVIEDRNSWVATGIWFFKWKRKFDPREVQAVNIGISTWESEEGTTKKVIELVADRSVKFGSMLPPDRLEWLRIVMKELLLINESNLLEAEMKNLDWINRNS